MYKIITTLLLVLSTCFVYAQWNPQTSGTIGYLHQIFFKDSLTGFCVGGGDAYAYPAAGKAGIILRTIDGGANWQNVYEDSTIAIGEVVARYNLITAFGRGYAGNNILLQSTNNGNTWIKDTVSFYGANPKYVGTSLYFVDAMDLMLKSLTFGVLQDVKQSANLVFDASLYGIYFPHAAPNLIIKSLDNGITWDTSSITISLSESPYSNATLRAFHDTIILAATYPNTLAYSFDSGITWNSFMHSAMGFKCFISSPKVMTGITSGKFIARSNDGGETFFIQDTMPHTISNFFFVNENLGYLCGDSGMIYKTTNGGGSLSVQQGTGFNNKLRLYPNPGKTMLYVDSPFESASMQLFDATGKLLSETRLTSKETSLSVEALLPGVYHITLTGPDGRQFSQKWMKQ